MIYTIKIDEESGLARNIVDFLENVADENDFLSVEKNEDDVVTEVLSNQKLRIEIALVLFQTMKYSIGKASRFAGMHLIEFQQILAERKIPIHYNEQDLEDDLNALKNF